MYLKIKRAKLESLRRKQASLTATEPWAPLSGKVKNARFSWTQLTTWLGVLVILGLSGCGQKQTTTLIPMPAKLQSQAGTFKLTPGSAIVTDAASRDTGEYLAARLRKSTGYKLPVRTEGEAPSGESDIFLSTKEAKASCGAEGYELITTPKSVVIRAPEQAGVFYGTQTLLQLLPPEALSDKAVERPNWPVACVQIEDQPRFKWRGIMLDVSRHFFTKQEVENLLDTMAFYKLNQFHWHLVDDQGWRIEIKKYPLLTEAGAWRKGVGFGLDPKATTAYGVDGRYGGFYTQEDIREVVAYAQARHITIVPEIEMPGHASAALTAYPQFSCTGGPFKTDLPGGIFDGVFCAGN